MGNRLYIVYPTQAGLNLVPTSGETAPPVIIFSANRDPEKVEYDDIKLKSLKFPSNLAIARLITLYRS